MLYHNSGSSHLLFARNLVPDLSRCPQLVDTLGTLGHYIFRNLVLAFLIFSRLVGTLVQSPLLWGKACAGSYLQIFDMASTSGYIGVKHVQEVVPRFFDMSFV